MADEATTLQPISDDQELAKVLAGVTAEDNVTPVTDDTTATPSDDTTLPSVDSISLPPIDPTLSAPELNFTESTVTSPEPSYTEPAAAPEPLVQPTPTLSTVNGNGDDLTNVKSDAINELRPLVDKLTLPPEEKFDTYLLLLRSTDDKALIEPAHATAKLIQDETRRAQALLDIIKEIDFLSQK